MATNKPELFSSSAGVGSGLRAVATSQQPKLFKTGSGTLAKLTAVALNTSTLQWVPWDVLGTNGMNTIRGFVWSDEITLHGTDEVIGQVMLGGKVHFDDLPANLGGAGAPTAAQVNAALRAVHTYGLIVEGIPATV